MVLGVLVAMVLLLASPPFNGAEPNPLDIAGCIPELRAKYMVEYNCKEVHLTPYTCQVICPEYVEQTFVECMKECTPRNGPMSCDGLAAM
jgi:hypothetical protein